MAMRLRNFFAQHFVHSEWLHICLFSIFALILRTIQLQTLPAALNRDEAALGYNAWMLSATGKDEWGEQWPLALRSFGDYKLPGYPILTMFSFWLVGRSDMAVRLPSALAGSLLPFAVWYLLKQADFSQRIRVIAGWLIAGAPFSVFYSRMGFEAVVGLSMFVFTTALSLQFLRNSRTFIRQLVRLFSLASILLAAIFTYNTPLLLTPFLILGLVVYGFGKSWRLVLSLMFALCIPALVGVLLLWQLSQQKAGISIFSDPTITAQISERYASATTLLERASASRYSTYLSMIWKSFIKSWSPEFLVLHGGSHPWHTIPQAGHLTWFHYCFALLGVGWSIISLLQKGLWLSNWSFNQRSRALFLWLLLSGLAPAVITVDAPHATRSLLFLTFLVVFTAIGIGQVFQWVTKHYPRMQHVVAVAVLFSALILTARYLYLYFVKYPQTQAMFQPGLANVLPKLKDSSRPILVAGDGYTYISLAWYQPIEPSEFIHSIERHPIDTIGFAGGKTVGQYTIRPDFNTPMATQSGLLFWQDNHWQVTQLP